MTSDDFLLVKPSSALKPGPIEAFNTPCSRKRLAKTLFGRPLAQSMQNHVISTGDPTEGDLNVVRHAIQPHNASYVVDNIRCGNSACPDLCEPREGNLPGPPGSAGSPLPRSPLPRLASSPLRSEQAADRPNIEYGPVVLAIGSVVLPALRAALWSAPRVAGAESTRLGGLCFRWACVGLLSVGVVG